MAEVVLFHRARGLTPGVIAFADELRRAGHTVHTPDLFEGRTFSTIEEGMAHAGETGFPDGVIERGTRAIEGLPACSGRRHTRRRGHRSPPGSPLLPALTVHPATAQPKISWDMTRAYAEPVRQKEHVNRRSRWAMTCSPGASPPASFRRYAGWRTAAI
jgi:hypothetical protein